MVQEIAGKDEAQDFKVKGDVNTYTHAESMHTVVLQNAHSSLVFRVPARNLTCMQVLVAPKTSVRVR
eukprot:9398225-Lingulodinium_polyedra.AAC.1